MPEPGTNEPIWSVSTALNHVKKDLQQKYASVWITGEISGLSTPYHWYFNLVEKNVSLNCAAFAGDHHRFAHIDFRNGSLVNAHGRFNIYSERGQFQLVVDQMELAGEGELRAAFERLKQKLETEGLFRKEHKKPIPPYPRRIALLTGEKAAAFDDVRQNLARRYPLAEIMFLPTQVQGRSAPPAIVNNLRAASDKTFGADVVLLTRGGGSYEDLSVFNDEEVARAIFACPLPVVSAIGHERDFTIADFVADMRAATPSTAVEVMTPDRHKLLDFVVGSKRFLNEQLTNSLKHREHVLTDLRSKLGDPALIIDNKANHLSSLKTRLSSAISNKGQGKKAAYDALNGRLHRATPERSIDTLKQRLEALNHRLELANPLVKLDELAKRRNEAKRRLVNFGATMFDHPNERLSTLRSRLARETPLKAIDAYAARVLQLYRNAAQFMRSGLQVRTNSLNQEAATLRAVSPLATLERGYAVVAKPDGSTWGAVVANIADVNVDDPIVAHVHGGTIDATVIATKKQAESSDESPSRA